ncbi:MAG: EAL domain-containing protein [Clostridiales bacterium]|nr:EAL domain-containing protein [Clostridiales bacterium]
MYILLIVREEIVCLIILVFLLINAGHYKMGKDSGNFLRLSLYALGHVLFDIITVYTVNHADTIPGWTNLAAHAIFYLFAIMFSYEFFRYTMSLCFEKNAIKKFSNIGLILPVLYFVLLPFLPIEYLKGNGTYYSMGVAPIVGYGIAMIYFLCSCFLVLKYFNKMESHIKVALIPMLFVLVCAELLQIFIPELLFTGGACTVVTVGFFFSLENPVEVFKSKVTVDAMTGVESRQGFEYDIIKLENSYQSDNAEKKNFISVVFCDINNLKEVNNSYGHLEGDTYISNIAQILLNGLKNSEKIYRMGGDEFMAIYRYKKEETIKKEIADIHDSCKALSEIQNYKTSVAIGYAVSSDEYRTVHDIINVADYNMYQNKIDSKKARAFMANSYDEANNKAGLTDRIFDALSATSDRNYLFINNMDTNVTRLSTAVVEYFGLPGKFIFNFGQMWSEYIHPDDREAYRKDIEALFLGKSQRHEMEYRARNKDGNYVVVTCRGGILQGKNGEADLFAGTIVNHGLTEYIDQLTGLHNDIVFMEDLDRIIESGSPVAILEISTMFFSRINILYGHSSGDDALCSFVKIIKDIIGDRGSLYRLDGIKFVAILPNETRATLIEMYNEVRHQAETNIMMGMLAIPIKPAGGAFLLNRDYVGTGSQVRNYLMQAHECSKYEQNGKLVFYSGPSDDSGSLDFNLLTVIHQDAVSEQKGFFLKYQPVVDMETGVIEGAEALVRWRSQERGEVMPNDFIPWLENDPCFFDVGKWILKKAVADAKDILKLMPKFVINVNITARQLQDERFRKVVLEAIEETGFPPGQLCLEVTERCKELDLPILKREIDYFHEHGIKMALDDIGTGAASFSLIFKLPFDVLKLDKQFVHEIMTRKANRTFVKMLTDTANDLGCTICFEGIENQDMYEYLKKYDDTSYQGYYFAKPLLFEDLKERVEKTNDIG